MIIYHSREALTARLAAALHTGRLDQEAAPSEAWEAIRAAEAYKAQGLWPAGFDGDGRAVWALGGASQHQLVQRLFDGLAELFQIPADRFLLVSVGPAHRRHDRGATLFRSVGALGWAYRLELWLIRRNWAEAVARAALGRFGVAQQSDSLI